MTATPAGWSRIPIVETLQAYRRPHLVPDLVAGTVLASMLIPQGMAYAELTGLPAITGIYTTIAALFAYAVFGRNRHLILGPDSSLAPVIAAIVLPLAAGDPNAAVALASGLGLLAGLMCVAAGFLRVGVVTELLSRPVRIGYLNGIAIVVLVSQLPKALGASSSADSPGGVLADTVRIIAAGDVVPAAAVLSLGSIVVIVVLRRLSRTIPGIAVAAVASILAVVAFDLASRGVEVVGSLPAGVPPLAMPSVPVGFVGPLLWGAILVTLVSFADTGALSTATALKSGNPVDPDDEIKALGAANLLASAVGGFPTSASSTRTAVGLALGARTQIAGLVAGAVVLAVLVVAPGIVADLPSATLAAIVITAAFALVDRSGTVWLFRVRKSEFWLSVAALGGVLLLGVVEGIGFAILLSLANFLRKAWRPRSTELGVVEGVAGYHDLARHPDAVVIPDLLLIRFDAPLFFANAPEFGRRVKAMIAHSDRSLTRVVVVANAITDVDTTGAEVLSNLLDDLDRRDIDLGFAGLKGPVRDHLHDYGLVGRIGAANFHPNTISAVHDHQRRRGV